MDNCQHFEKTIKGVDDFELGINRDSLLSYAATFPVNKKPNGIVLVIPGFGGDSKQEYQKKLRTHIATQYNLIAVSVDYHAINLRPQTGAKILFEQDDILLLQNSLQRNNLPLQSDLSANLYALSKAASNNNRMELLSGTLTPPNKDYQNFGIMQAIDHLFALSDLLQHHSIEDKDIPIIAFGSSHGGYIANLLAKLAPNTFVSVFDNSAYISSPYQYVLGRQTNMHEFSYQEQQYPNILFKCYSLNKWSLDRNSSNYFSRDRQEIRAFYSRNHLKEMAKFGNTKTQYRFIHSLTDRIAPFIEKKRYSLLLKNLGFDVIFKEISNKDIDGKFVKNLDHGMGLSLKIMFENFFSTITLKKTPNDFQRGSTITYEGFGHDYVFRYDRFSVIPQQQVAQ